MKVNSNAMASSERKEVVGPRSIQRTQKCRELAQMMMQKEREEILRQQNDSPSETPESTATAANSCAMKMSKSSFLDASSEQDAKDLSANNMKREEAVTYWSHELIAGDKPHFPVTSLTRSSPLFTRCASFTNEIEDSRVRHSEDDIGD